MIGGLPNACLWSVVSLFWIAPIYPQVGKIHDSNPKVFNSLEVKDPDMNSPLGLLIINHYLSNGQFGKNKLSNAFWTPNED